MKLFLTLLTAITLVGCGKIHSYQLLKATEICGDYKNINYILYESDSIVSVRCIDGKYERIS